MAEQVEAYPATTKWLPENSRKIVERIVVTGKLKLKTPAHFGGGDSNGTEMILLEDTLDRRPLLPGASIAGALRNYLLNREQGYRQPEAGGFAEKLFGVRHSATEGEQSRVMVDDARGHERVMEYRDGVKLSPETHTAEDKKLFSVQVWPVGTTFDLTFELLLYETDNPEEVKQVKQAFAVALSGLSDGSITLGARKRRGYGRVNVASWTVTKYDLRTRDGLARWLNNSGTSTSTSNLFESFGVSKDFVDQRTYARITATFAIDGSLLIRAGSDVAEMAHLTSNGKPILSGTAVTGAIRARAARIVATRKDASETRNVMDDLFGPFGEEGNEQQKLTASRFTATEQVIEVPPQQGELVQNRVRIDSFTGGAYETALFDQQPVFGSGQTLVDVTFEIQKPYDGEIGLLLLLLKDLWCSDLPLGGESGVGRGRLRGVKAEISVKEANQRNPEQWTITDEGGTLRVSDNKQALERYVERWWEKII